ncbi:hypothetical protein [Kitasatospora sp. NPDC051914]|uniref:hypothetical protein n=1 Tax=Kitasatospora sp. NPDC051914 TaxID=3154945 RepID=UPI0034179756
MVAGPPGPRAPLAAASAARRRVGRSSWTTPRLVRAFTALCLACVLGLGGAVASVLAGARDGIDTIGHRAAPQAVRAADLYFALSDMDAQAANLLLIGADPDYLALRRQTLDTYEQRRTQAGEDLQRAAEAAAEDPAGQRRELAPGTRVPLLSAKAYLPMPPALRGVLIVELATPDPDG